jgi:signal transduction histidine kinase
LAAFLHKLGRTATRIDYLGVMRERASVLIVDDNVELAENVADLLTSHMHEYAPDVTIANSADVASDAARERQYDVALLDLHLLDGSGLELMEQLKGKSPFLQAVFITGDGTVHSAIRALEHGAFGYLLKPFDTTQLIELSRRAIERSHLLHERETLRTEVEQSQRRLREVVDQVPAFVTAIAEDGKILVWNQQLEAVTGFRAEEMLARDGSGFRDGEDVQRLALKGGGHRSVRWKRARVEDSQHQRPVTYAVGVDVTEELELERRTRQAERLASAGTLAAGLAHELRNPLNSATLQLQLLERRLRRGKLEVDAGFATIAAMQSEIERLSRLVDDFLAFAKPQPLHVEATNLTALVEQVFQQLRPEARAAGVSLATDVQHVGLVPVDPGRIRQALLNLIKNSIDAIASTGQGNVVVRIHPEPHSAFVVTEVEDDGPGFRPDAPVFDAFYTSKDSGTGLGLAIVHRVVSEHGGTIQATSTAGRTRFRITLPQPESAGPAADPRD